MKYGVCGGFEIAAIAAREGYDYMEWSVASFLKPLEAEEQFAALLAQARNLPIRYTALNGLVPATLKITGPDADLAHLEKYLETVMKRAEIAGVDTAVFGSGGARQIPEGFDRDKAHRQIAAFCRMMAPIAERHGVTIAVEPLNTRECNVLTTVAECAELVKEVAHPAVRLLTDAYHLMKDNDSYDSIIEHGTLLSHTHIATVPNRLPPAAEDCDLAPFFNCLMQVGYDGGVSIEGKIKNPETELGPALAMMRALSS